MTVEHDIPTLEALKQRLADFVSIRRTQMGISQRRLAELTGTTEQYICGIENAKRNPSFYVLYKLIEVLDLPVNALFHGSLDGTKDERGEVMMNHFLTCEQDDRDIAYATFMVMFAQMRSKAAKRQAQTLYTQTIEEVEGCT